MAGGQAEETEDGGEPRSSGAAPLENVECQGKEAEQGDVQSRGREEEEGWGGGMGGGIFRSDMLVLTVHPLTLQMKNAGIVSQGKRRRCIRGSSFKKKEFWLLGHSLDSEIV